VPTAEAEAGACCTTAPGFPGETEASGRVKLSFVRHPAVRARKPQVQKDKTDVRMLGVPFRYSDPVAQSIAETVGRRTMSASGPVGSAVLFYRRFLGWRGWRVLVVAVYNRLGLDGAGGDQRVVVVEVDQAHALGVAADDADVADG